VTNCHSYHYGTKHKFASFFKLLFYFLSTSKTGDEYQLD